MKLCCQILLYTLYFYINTYTQRIVSNQTILLQNYNDNSRLTENRNEISAQANGFLIKISSFDFHSLNCERYRLNVRRIQFEVKKKKNIAIVYRMII